jgi:hypothetical protein
MPRLLALLLLLGSLLLIVCAGLHPILPLTGPADLALIGATGHWRLIHLGLLYATGLIIAGVWGRWLVAEPAERPGLAAAFAILALGEALNGVNIGYMTGAGTFFAGLAAGGAEVATVYQALHLSAVMAGKLGGFLVAISAGLIALTTRQRSDEPRALVTLAGIACLAGLAGNLLATPGHPLMLTSVGLMAVWQVGTAARLLRN